MSKPRSPRDRLKKTTTETRSLRHIEGRKGLISEWQAIATSVYSRRVCQGMPKFVAKLAKTFWHVDPSEVVRAITDGDPAFFAAFLLRLDQIDCALVSEGRGIAERAPITKAKFVIDGFLEAATKSLKKNGGEWPPSDPTSKT